MLGRPGFLVVGSLAFALVGCSGAPRETGHATASASAPPRVSASASASAAPVSLPKSQSTFVAHSRPAIHDLEPQLPPQPCDFARSYRGKLGERGLTILLSNGASGLSGWLHFDEEGPATAITGTVKDGAFELTAGKLLALTGKCDERGALVGAARAGKSKANVDITLSPLPPEWPGLYWVARDLRVLPNHPDCKKAAQRDRIIEIQVGPNDYDTAICLPSDPKIRKELLADATDFGCTASDTGYRVFGLADSQIEARVNTHLKGGYYDETVKEISVCNGKRHSWVGMSLVYASRELLVTSGFASEDFGGAHPMNGGMGAQSIDLSTGEPVRLDEVITDSAALRDLTGECLGVYFQVPGDEQAFEPELGVVRRCEDDGLPAYLWGCDGDAAAEPVWALLPDGVQIGSYGNPHVSAVLDGQGPILPFAVLAREGLLRRDSRPAHLWANVTPAAADELPCSSALEGETVRWWTRQP
ncbi:MAG: hypothetical protein U0271_24355 [Polyangiaceae bacterium]